MLLFKLLKSLLFSDKCGEMICDELCVQLVKTIYD